MAECTTYHKDLIGADLHVPGYLQTTDPGAIGASKYWIDTSAGTGKWVLKVRNSANSGWETAGSSTSNFTDLDDVPSSYSSQALKALRVNATETGIEFYTTTDTDEKTKVSANDTTAGYLNGKLVAGTGITLIENNDGENETLSIISSLTLDQLTDVNIGSGGPLQGQLLRYTAAYGWHNWTPNYLTSFTETDPIYSANIYATSMNQTVATTSIPTFSALTLSGLTSGRIPYVSTSGLLADTTSLLWNNSLSLLTVLGPTYIRGTAEFTGTGTVGASGTTVTGTGTLFLTECRAGSKIRTNAGARTVTAVASNLSLTVDTSFTQTAGRTVFFTFPTFEFWSSAVNRLFYYSPNDNVNYFTGGLALTTLTSGRVACVSTGGRFIDFANLLYDSNNLTISGGYMSALWAILSPSTEFIDFNATNVNTNPPTTPISSWQADGTVDGPKRGSSSTQPGWKFRDMVKVYTKDTSGNYQTRWLPDYSFHCGANCQCNIECNCNTDIHCSCDANTVQCSCNVDCGSACNIDCSCNTDSGCGTNCSCNADCGAACYIDGDPCNCNQDVCSNLVCACNADCICNVNCNCNADCNCNTDACVANCGCNGDCTCNTDCGGCTNGDPGCTCNSDSAGCGCNLDQCGTNCGVDPCAPDCSCNADCSCNSNCACYSDDPGCGVNCQCNADNGCGTNCQCNTNYDMGCGVNCQCNVECICNVDAGCGCDTNTIVCSCNVDCADG